MTIRFRTFVPLLALGWALGVAQPALAQVDERRFGVRGVIDVAPQLFAASDTFEAILGTEWGTFFGGGGQARWKDLVFEVTASQFKKTGERVFVAGGEVFPLGIPATITLRPIELTAAYRLPRLWRFRPYAGAAPNADFNEKSFNSSVVARWEYRPGSTLFVVWTQGREQSDRDLGTFDARRDYGNLFGARPDNVLLVKAAYWLGR